MAHVAQMLTQEPIYKPSSIFSFKPILLSAHKLILLIYGDNTSASDRGAPRVLMTAVLFWSRGVQRPRVVPMFAEGPVEKEV